MTARRVAVAANLVALVVVALLAFADARLLAPRQSRVPAAIPFAAGEGVPRRVLLVDTPLGLSGAVATALLRVALPPLALGWALAAARERDRGHTFAASRATVAPGAFAAVHLGGALLCFVWIVVAADGRTAALGLGGLLRLLNELCWVALGVGLAARAFSAVPSS